MKRDCLEEKCSGNIEYSHPVGIKLNFGEPPITGYYCRKCGRIYLFDGSPLSDNEGSKVFKEGRDCVIKDSDNQVVAIAPLL